MVDSAIFIKDLFDTVLNKTYLPASSRPAPAMPQIMTAQHAAPPTGPASMQYNNLPGLGNAPPTGPSNAKKRNFDDRGDAEVLLGRLADDFNGRQLKQPRTERTPAPHWQKQYDNYQVPAPQMPQMPPGMPPFDLADPLSMMQAMQAMGMQFPPGMPGFGNIGASAPPATNGRGAPQKGSRLCRDYATKGFCARGNDCKFEHTDSTFMPQGASDEYDPTSSSLLINKENDKPKFESRHQPPRDYDSLYQGQSERGGRGRGGGQFSSRGGPNGSSRGGRGGRSEFASDRPNYDRTKTKIVVENIPEEKFNEFSIREFFSQFGTIIDLETHDYKSVAVINFENYDQAKAAYSSPKVIFDNRFVKVFWYRDEESLPQAPPNYVKKEYPHHSRHGSGDITMKPAPEPIDMEEFAKKQAEAQAAHEEKEKKKLLVEKQREEMQKKAEELLAKQAEEKKKLMERLAAMEKKTRVAADQPKSEAQLLREKMEALQAETKRLTEAKAQVKDEEGAMSWHPSAPRGRGRGGYRGRGAYTPYPHAPSHSPSPVDAESSVKVEEGSSQAEALKMLAKLQAEAAELGIDPNNVEDQVGAWPTRGRGRGGFRGRGTFPPRGRGAFRGRGGAFGSGANAYKLDNRPKTVAISGADFTDASKDEALRQFLLVSIPDFYFPPPLSSVTEILTINQGVGEFGSIEQKGGKAEVTFNDRFTAEKFFYGLPNNELPGVGKVELAWIQKPLPPVTLTSAVKTEDDTSSPAKDSEMNDSSMMESNDDGELNGGQMQVEHDTRERDLDYDDGDNEWAQ